MQKKSMSFSVKLKFDKIKLMEFFGNCDEFLSLLSLSSVMADCINPSFIKTAELPL
jgi:hypothetical protein